MRFFNNFCMKRITIKIRIHSYIGNLKGIADVLLLIPPPDIIIINYK